MNHGFRVALFLGALASSALCRASDGEARCDQSGSKLRCSVGSENWNVEAPASWSISAPERDDIRFEARQGDVSDWDLKHNHQVERTEISGFNSKERIDSDLWFSMDLMVEPGPTVTSRWLVLGQLHPSESPGEFGPSPAWAQELNAGDVFRIVMRTKSDVPLRSSPAPTVLFVDPQFQRGRSYHLVYHLRYSQSQGLLDAWRDGQHIAHYVGALGYIHSQGPYFKFGIYRDPAPETLVVHYKNLRFGSAVAQP